MDAKDMKNGEVDRVSQLAKAQDALESFLSALESSPRQLLENIVIYTHYF